MTYILILLGLIALSEVTRLFLTHRDISKKRHFKQKLSGVQRMIWDLQFKIFKTREMREDVRKEYDLMKARIAAFETQLKGKEKDSPEAKTIEDNLTRANRDKERLEGQMKQLDLEINGSRPTNDYPDGVSGANDQIESLRELERMLKDWIKEI